MSPAPYAVGGGLRSNVTVLVDLVAVGRQAFLDGLPCRPALNEHVARIIAARGSPGDPLSMQALSDFIIGWTSASFEHFGLHRRHA
jgi:hypothetical protein